MNVRRSVTRTIFSFAMTACVFGLPGKASAQVYNAGYAQGTVYGAPQINPTPQAAIPPILGGCYTSTTVINGSCYTITPGGTYSCFNPSTPPTYTPPTPQSAAPAYYAVYCHDTLQICETVTLNRYYPVYVHLKPVVIPATQLVEKWNPYCVVCTKSKPCPKHVGGQTPADLPPPADATPVAPGVAPAAQAPPAAPGEVAPPPVAPTPAPPAAAPPAAAPPAEVPAAPTAPAAEVPAAPGPQSAVAAPQKTWVFLNKQNVWGYGYKRADGLWVIDAGSKTATPPTAVSAAPAASGNLAQAGGN